MLTQKDIDDLKLYLKDFDDFCKNRLCQPDTCFVLAYVKNTDKRLSCFKTYCRLREAGKVV